MKGFQPDCVYLKILVLTAMVVLLVTGDAGQARAGGWFKAAAGVSGMAMDDVNKEDFRFYDYSAEGFNLPNLDAGFSLSFHLGYDLSEKFSLGFSWDRQYARVSGTDQDVTGHLNLDANFFMAHVYWRPLHTGRWDFGAAGGLGLVFPDGKVKVTGPNNVNYGEGETSGSSGLPLELMALVDFALSKKSVIEVTLGWRMATIKDFKYENAPVLKEDGTNMELDYTGYIIKAGYKILFGD
jgi:hypothetical protein